MRLSSAMLGALFAGFGMMGVAAAFAPALTHELLTHKTGAAPAMSPKPAPLSWQAATSVRATPSSHRPAP